MEAELVSRARAGDVAAFEALVLRHTAALLGLATVIILDADLAADVVQDALLQAWRQLPRLRDPDAFQPWLRRIVINGSRNALREKRTVRLDEVAVGPGPARDTDRSIDLHAALRSLTPAHREVVALHYLHGASIDDIASLLHVPPGTVKSRLFAARARLRDALGDAHG